MLQPSHSNTSLKTKITKNTKKGNNLLTQWGKLEIPKCAISVMEWEEDKDNLSIICNSSSISNIPIVNSSTNQVDIIPSIPTSQAYKLLGIQIEGLSRKLLQVGI